MARKNYTNRDKKVCDIKVRLSPEMYHKLKQHIIENNLNLSSYIRYLIKKELGE